MKKEMSGEGAMCGGVISESLFNSNPGAYMMSYYMADDKFKKYVELKKSGKDKEATRFFNKHAYSAI